MTDCSSRLYHIDDRRRNVGCETASNRPRRMRSAHRIVKLNPKQVIVIVRPHRKMFAARYFAMGTFWTRMTVGNSAARMPK